MNKKGTLRIRKEQKKKIEEDLLVNNEISRNLRVHSNGIHINGNI